jgi:Ion transport protein
VLCAGRFDFANGKPRANFDNFWTAFLSMFQVASQQNWPYVMFDSMRVAGKVGAVVCKIWISVRLLSQQVYLTWLPIAGLTVRSDNPMSTCPVSSKRWGTARGLFLHLQSAPIVALFYALYFLATNFILLNLIVAAVLEQYSVRDSEKRALQRRAAIRSAANTQVGQCTSKCPIWPRYPEQCSKPVA